VSRCYLKPVQKRSTIVEAVGGPLLFHWLLTEAPSCLFVEERLDLKPVPSGIFKEEALDLDVLPVLGLRARLNSLLSQMGMPGTDIVNNEREQNGTLLLRRAGAFPGLRIHRAEESPITDQIDLGPTLVDDRFEAKDVFIESLSLCEIIVVKPRDP